MLFVVFCLLFGVVVVVLVYWRFSYAVCSVCWLLFKVCGLCFLVCYLLRVGGVLLVVCCLTFAVVACCNVLCVEVCCLVLLVGGVVKCWQLLFVVCWWLVIVVCSLRVVCCLSSLLVLRCLLWCVVCRVVCDLV